MNNKPPTPGQVANSAPEARAERKRNQYTRQRNTIGHSPAAVYTALANADDTTRKAVLQLLMLTTT